MPVSINAPVGDKRINSLVFEDYTDEELEIPAAATALNNIKSQSSLSTLFQNVKAFGKGCLLNSQLVKNTSTNNSNLPLAASVGYSLNQNKVATSNVLTLEEIAAASNLSGKVASASSVNSLNTYLTTNIQDLMTAYKKKVHDGRNLGSSFTDAQSQAIRNWSFTGMGVGDYWQIGGHNWRIWDINWYLNKGDSQCTTPHLVIMPDDNLLDADGSSTHYMNDTNTTDGAYAGTKYRSTYRSQCESVINSCFGNGHILGHRELLANSTSDGKASGWGWYDCTVELPSEIMMYGSTIWGNSTIAGSAGHNIGTAYPQLALASLDPSRVINRENYWLRDVVSSACFAYVYTHGHAYYYNAAVPWIGVRPYFLLY